MPKFVVVDIEHCGEYFAGMITISSLMSTPDLAKATLLHEMVHQWQDHNGFPLDHKSRFQEWAGMILVNTQLEI